MHAVPPAEWHTYRRDNQLTGRCLNPGAIVRPTVHWQYALGGSENEVFVTRNPDGSSDLLLAYGGCVVRTSWRGEIVWKTPSYGLNAIGRVVDLDGDGSEEILASTGYEVFVLSAKDGRVLLRDYVGFPASAGTPANMMLCHRFDPSSAGMHLVVPMMSSKEVRVFDFRKGSANVRLAHTLWMDDAYHPTVAAADLDNDGLDELVVSKLCGVYVFDVLNGTMKSSARWTSNGERHRNYGLLQLIDIDNDGTLEIVIAADRVARHLSVLKNDGKGNLSLLWDRFVEFIYPNDTTEVRHTGNSVSDVDGDGKRELVVSFFNARGDGRWWLEIIDPVSGAVKHELPDRYLWGVQDIDGDGILELFVSKEDARQPKAFSASEILKYELNENKLLWSAPRVRFAGRSLRPEGWRSNFRDVPFKHDETWTDLREDSASVFLFEPSGKGEDIHLVELKITNEGFSTRSIPLEGSPHPLMVNLADVNGDGVKEPVLSDATGTLRILGRDGTVLSQFTTGYRLQMEGFFAARPSPTPIVFRDMDAGAPLVAIPDNNNTLHVLDGSSRGDSERRKWIARGRGHIGYELCYHSFSVADLDGDGRRELLALNPDHASTSELLEYTLDGAVKRSWTIPGAPPPSPVRVGVYEWVIVPKEGTSTIIASFYASESMNSEQTICIDREGKQLWHHRFHGEGEWGRGVGPYCSYSLLSGREDERKLFFLAKDLLCEVNAETGSWNREPWLLWHATTVAMGQSDWEFTKERHADFGTEKDPFTAYGSPMLIDLDGDGEEEILVGACFGGMGALKQDHSVLWWKRTPFTDIMMRMPGVADLEGTGKMFVGICHANGALTCYEGANGKEVWSLPLNSTTSDIVSCDIDGDGREEFITGTTDGRLIAVGTGGDGKGYIKWALPLGSALGNPVVADVDGDGLPEILVVTGDGSLVCVGPTPS